MFLNYLLVRIICKFQIKNFISKNLESIDDSLLYYFYLEDILKKIRWEENNKEFILDSQLYDIIKIKYINGKTLLICLNDKDETNVLNTFLKLNKKYIIDYLKFLLNQLYLPSKVIVEIFNDKTNKLYKISSINYAFAKINDHFQPP